MSGKSYPKSPQAYAGNAERAVCHLRDCIASSFLEVQATAHRPLRDGAHACVAGKTSSMRLGNDEAPEGEIDRCRDDPVFRTHLCRNVFPERDHIWTSLCSENPSKVKRDTRR